MDRDDEIDKILKQKFENKILPSEEFENNMKKIINEQKSKRIRSIKDNNYYIYRSSICDYIRIRNEFYEIWFYSNSNNINNKNRTNENIWSNLSEDSEFIIYTDKDANIESVKKSLYIEQH